MYLFRAIGLWLLIVACALGVLAWNGTRFIGTKSQPRMKDLSFLPPPVVAQALSLGQGSALAKLRWIDSFAYFEYQIDRQNDSVAGRDSRGGFTRLYETLIALDPRFVPFYEHAVLNTAGVLKNHQAALGFAMTGIGELPHETGLWRIAAAELAASYQWTKRNPTGLDAFLRAWTDAEPTEEGKKLVLDWRRGLAFQTIEGLETLTWWQEQLRVSRPGTALGDFVEGTMRELLATHAVSVIPRLEADSASLVPFIQLDPAHVAKRYPHGIRAWEPVEIGPGGVRLRCDPFGWPFRREGGRIVSPGLEQRKFLTLTLSARSTVEQRALKEGRPPHDAAEASTWVSGPFPVPPEGGRWSFSNPRPEVVWPTPPSPPWPLR